MVKLLKRTFVEVKNSKSVSGTSLPGLPALQLGVWRLCHKNFRPSIISEWENMAVYSLQLYNSKNVLVQKSLQWRNEKQIFINELCFEELCIMHSQYLQILFSFTGSIFLALSFLLIFERWAPEKDPEMENYWAGPSYCRHKHKRRRNNTGTVTGSFNIFRNEMVSGECSGQSYQHHGFIKLINK